MLVPSVRMPLFAAALLVAAMLQLMQSPVAAASSAACTSGTVDAFGATPSRHGALATGEQACFAVHAEAGGKLGVHLVTYTDSDPVTGAWTLLGPDGHSCSGSDDVFASLCSVTATGSWQLTVSSPGAGPVDYAVSLTDAAAATGCRPAASTAWDAGPRSGALAAAQVDCVSLRAESAQPVVRVGLSGGRNLSYVVGTVVDAGGSGLCQAASNGYTDCRLPGPGLYRVLISTNAFTSLRYGAWTIEITSTAGCPATTLDAMGTVPTRSSTEDGVKIEICWRFTAPAGSMIETRGADDSSFLVAAEVFDIHGERVCTYSQCKITEAGTHFAVFSFLPGSGPGGTFTMGIWRLDRPTGCTSTGTSFTGSAVSGSLDDILELDCAQFSADPHDTVVVHTVGNVSQELHDGTGAYACANITRGSCELTGPAPYRVLTYGSNPVGYQFRVVSLTRQVGCHTVPATTFGHAPAGSFTLADAADLACFRSDRANVGGQVLLRTARAATDPPANVTMYPPSGATQCTGTAEIDRCAGGPAGRYLFLVGAAAATSGSFGWYDISTDDGCRVMTSTAFGAAPTRGSVADRGAVDCMTVPVVPTDSVRLAFAPPAAALDLHAWMPLGDRVAAPPCDAGGVDPVDCKLRATAPATTHAYVWAANTSGADAGTYYLHAWRLNAPMGCRDIGSLKDGFGPLVRTLRDSNDEFCYQGTALAGGVLDVTTANDDVPTDIPQMQFLRPGGRRDCTVQGSGTCSLQVSQTYSLLVLRGSGVPDFTGRYRVSGDCTNDSCGP